MAISIFGDIAGVGYTGKGVWGTGERVSLAENLKAALASEKPEHVLRNALLLDNAFPKGYTSLSQVSAPL